ACTDSGKITFITYKYSFGLLVCFHFGFIAYNWNVFNDILYVTFGFGRISSSPWNIIGDVSKGPILLDSVCFRSDQENIENKSFSYENLETQLSPNAKRTKFIAGLVDR